VLGPVVKEAIPAEEISWISWKPEALALLSARDDDDDDGGSVGIQTKHIKANKKGKVGGGKTFHNKVKLPAHSLTEDMDITVAVLNVVDGQQAGAGVDFLPSQQFLRDVQVTLSWAYLDVPPGSDPGIDFTPYYSEDGGSTWYELTNYSVDYQKQRIVIWVDHFTRFSWGI